MADWLGGRREINQIEGQREINLQGPYNLLWLGGEVVNGEVTGGRMAAAGTWRLENRRCGRGERRSIVKPHFQPLLSHEWPLTANKF